MSTKSKRGSEPTLAELRNMIRAAGLRSTAPRIAVLRLLQAATMPSSHGDVYEALQHEGFDRATLYRNLMDLAEVGILKRSDVGDHVWRFELAQRDGHNEQHPHFVCTDCGIVACLPGVAVKIESTSAVPRALRRKAIEVQLKGLCDACARIAARVSRDSQRSVSGAR